MKTIRRQLRPGVWLTAHQTEKFKSGYWSVSLLTPLAEETAAENALVPRVLRRGCASCPDMTALTRTLDELYGGAVEAAVRKKGEIQCVGFAGAFLDDAYALEPMDLTSAAAGLLGELLLSPVLEGGLLPAASVEGERANLVRQIRGEINDKGYYAQLELLRRMCAGEAFQVDRQGSLARAEALGREEATAAWRRLLAEAQVELYYCGSADGERISQVWSRALEGLPQGTDRRRGTTRADAAPRHPAPRRFEERLDVTQGKLALGFRTGGVTLGAEAYPALLVLNALYGGTTNSKLFRNVREKRSLCYYASSGLERHKGLMVVSSGVEFDRMEEACGEILEQWEACRRGDFTAEELDAARRSVATGLRTTMDSQGALEDYWLGQAAAGGAEGPLELAARVEQVTADQVTAQAGRTELDAIYEMKGRA